MVRRRNLVVFCVSIIIPIVLSIILFKLSVVDIDGIILEGKSFQYNVISYSAIIAGFLFTGISILISAIDKERIKRLWDNHYLDNLYRSAMLGIMMNVVSITLALSLAVCCISESIIIWLLRIEVTAIVIGLVQFVWCVNQLFKIVRKLKTKPQN